ncbi:hypothetical protein ACFYVK_13020 [Streptomyces chartreusis]|uniref:hypothetical protein n=1 Tax=Streptomyces chartreusis TaxID=1969 RepID=UPI0036B4FA05
MADRPDAAASYLTGSEMAASYLAGSDVAGSDMAGSYLAGSDMAEQAGRGYARRGYSALACDR